MYTNSWKQKVNDNFMKQLKTAFTKDEEGYF